MHKEETNSQHPSDTVPIIEDAEQPLDGTAETSNNKTIHQFDTVNMPAHSLSHVPCNDIRLQSGKIVEPIIIEDVPSLVHEEGSTASI